VLDINLRCHRHEIIVREIHRSAGGYHDSECTYRVSRGQYILPTVTQRTERRGMILSQSIDGCLKRKRRR
jgi:hypothetical protein